MSDILSAGSPGLHGVFGGSAGLYLPSELQRGAVGNMPSAGVPDVLVAAYDARSDDVRGLGGALATLAQQPFGPWLLGIVASGLVVYGAFMIVKARYGRLVVR